MDLLIIEDNATDRLVIETRLRRGFPNARLSVADDLRQLRENLKHENCDVVVTDYWLGWTDGLSVLQQVRERWPRARVILLTGNGGEEVVADAFKLGLFRYLFKPEGFNELVGAAKQAFESRQREDKQALMEGIVAVIPHSLLCVDSNGIVTISNQTTHRMYGYHEHQIVGRSFEELIPENDRGQWRHLHEEALRGNLVPSLKTVRLQRNGTSMPVVASLIPIRDEHGKISQVVHLSSPID